MSIQHYMPENEPVLLSILEGDIDVNEVQELFAFVDELITERDLPMLYWIGDSRAVNATHEIMLKSIEITMSGTKGSGGDDRVIPLMVMDEKLYDYFTGEFQNRYSWTKFPVFKSTFEAFEFVQYLRGLNGE